MHQWLQGATFHIEHVVPICRDGDDAFENLALACPSCNLQKSDRTSAIDPKAEDVVALFHSRRQRRSDHFEFEKYSSIAKTATGRATSLLLNFNHDRKLKIREAEQLFGLFPPE